MPDHPHDLRQRIEALQDGHPASTQDRLELFLAASPNAIIVADAAGRIVMVNAAAERLLGYRASELRGQLVEILVPPRLRHHHVSYREGYTHAPQPRPMGHGRDLYALHKDGSEIPVEVALNPFETSSGRLIVSVFVDITERKRAEIALRRSEERLETVFDNMSEGLILAKLDSQLIHWNKAALSLHDFVDEHEGLRALPEFARIFELRTLAGDIVPFQDWPLERIFHAGRLHDCQVHVRRLDRDWHRIFSYRGAIVQEPSGERIAFLTIRDITARVHAEKELRRVADFNDTVLNSVLAQIAVLDASGTIIAVNDAWRSFAAEGNGDPEVPREGSIGQNYLEICRQSDGPYAQSSEAVFAGLTQILQGQSDSFTYEYPCHRIHSDRWFLLIATRLRSTEGGAVISHTEITERKQAERAVTESEQRFRALVDASAQLVWTTGPDGLPDQDSPAWREFTGQTIDQGAGMGWLEAIHPDDRGQVIQTWQTALLAKAPHNLRYRLWHQKLGWRWVSVRAVPMFQPDGAIRQWVGMATDVTERRAQQELIERQARLLDQATEAILVWNVDGIVQTWNKGAERMFGYTGEEALGRCVFDLICLPDDAQLVEEARAKLKRDGEWSGELRKRTKHGKQLVVEARWNLLPDGEPGQNVVLNLDVDITSKKALESQYLRAQRMESLGTLAGGIAHDLNNMLSPILMSIVLLKAKLPSPEDQEVLQMLEEGATRGANMVRQILTFARGVEGQRVLLSPKHIIKDVCRILSETLLKQIEVEDHMEPYLWLVSGDATQLHQVLLNLCVNARDAMPNGGKLTISASNRELDANYAAMHIEAKAGHYVMISVADTGCGIPEAIRDRIFEPFFTTKETGRGTGLGLATSSAIVKSHGGFINLYSEVGKGTVFKVYLPAEPGESESSLAAQVNAITRGQGQLILVIDDETSIRTITKQTLEAFGYRVVTATDGADGVAKFAQHLTEVSVVFTDLMMPIMDGVSTIHAIRRMRQDVPILAASGLGSEAQNHAAKAAGAQHFIHKPYTAEAILRLLAAVLQRHPVPDETLGGE